MPNTFEFNLAPNEVTFDPFGRVIIKNEEFVNALNGLSEGALAAATCNNGCGDTGCGNNLNSGCASTSKVFYDDWTIFNNEAIIKNANLSKALLDSKFASDPIIPVLIEEL